MGRSSKLETKRDHYLKMEVHVMKCKREVERKDKELKVSKVIKILEGGGEKTR